MTIKYVSKLLWLEKNYISEYIHYQKLHFCTPVICKGGIIWCVIVHQTIPGVYIGRGIFLTVTPASKIIKNHNIAFHRVHHKKNKV